MLPRAVGMSPEEHIRGVGTRVEYLQRSGYVHCDREFSCTPRAYGYGVM